MSLLLCAAGRGTGAESGLLGAQGRARQGPDFMRPSLCPHGNSQLVLRGGRVWVVRVGVIKSNIAEGGQGGRAARDLACESSAGQPSWPSWPRARTMLRPVDAAQQPLSCLLPACAAGRGGGGGLIQVCLLCNRAASHQRRWWVSPAGRMLQFSPTCRSACYVVSTVLA
jgi:hypothetical protein